jgi:4'-phosphopantetheinyl transferase
MTDRPPRRRVRPRSTLARQALCFLARSIGLSIDDWAQDARGAPLPRGGWFWSIAHSRQWAAAVIHDRPVGIDVEPADVTRDRLRELTASPSEWKSVAHLSHSFTRVWTAKEAVLKAVGVGLSGLDRCRIRRIIDHRRWVVRYGADDWVVEHYPWGGHVAAVASVGEPVAWRVIEADGEEFASPP